MDISNIHLEEVKARAQSVGKSAINSGPGRVLGGLGRFGVGTAKVGYGAAKLGVGGATVGGGLLAGAAYGGIKEAAIMGAGVARGAGILGSMAFKTARAMSKPIQVGMYLGMAATIGAASYLYNEHQQNREMIDASYTAGNISQPGSMEATGDLVFAMHNLRSGYRPTNL